MRSSELVGALPARLTDPWLGQTSILTQVFCSSLSIDSACQGTRVGELSFSFQPRIALERAAASL
jgi:hypothetical protein